MQRGTFGQKVQESGILQFDMAVGGISVVVPFTKDILTKDVAFDEQIKRRIEVDDEIRVIKPSLVAKKEIYMLVAKLNTDQSGQIVPSNNFDIEYLKLSVKKYNEICKQQLAIPNFTSIYVSKEEKKFDNKTINEFKYTLSPTPLPQQVTSRMAEVVNAEGVIDGLFNMIDLATSTPKETYLQLLKDANEQIAIGAPTQTQSIPQSTAQIQANPQLQTQAQGVQGETAPQAQGTVYQPQQPQQPQVSAPQSFQATAPQSFFGGMVGETTTNNDPLPF